MVFGSPSSVKNKIFKRHAASIRRTFAGVFRLLRCHIMRFMLTRGEICPGLPTAFRRGAKISAVGGRDAAEKDTPIVGLNWPWSFEGEGKLLEDGGRHRRRA